LLEASGVDFGCGFAALRRIAGLTPKRSTRYGLLDAKNLALDQRKLLPWNSPAWVAS
jgi:hypothetical protein